MALIVLESSTKYLGGHSDCVGGFVAGSDELMKDVWHTAVYFGANADPFAAFLCRTWHENFAIYVWNATILMRIKLQNFSRS